jgi:ATP/maltotriose-dependent transcriptional regulator MalT
MEATGLIRRLPGRTAGYAAIAPEVGLELLLQRREEEVRRARVAASALTERFHQGRISRPPSDLVEVITGQQDVNEQYAAIYRTARDQLRVMTRPPYHQSLEENRTITAEAHGRRLLLRAIIDPRYIEQWGFDLIREDIRRGEQYRAIEHVPLKLVVADDRVALIPLENPPNGIQSALLVRSSALLEALVDVFETLWQLASPLDILTSDRDLEIAGTSLSENERLLVALLAAGIPDDVIAQRLAVSLSTVHRRIQSLKARLGAASRFQAGLQAARHGWFS